MRGIRNSAVAAVTAAAIAITSAGVAPAFAAPRAKSAPVAEKADSTEFSSRRYRSRHYRNNAAAAAMMTAIIGGIATYAAAREYRKARQRHYGYYGAPYGYYGGGPYYRYYRY